MSVVSVVRWVLRRRSVKPVKAIKVKESRKRRERNALRTEV